MSFIIGKTNIGLVIQLDGLLKEMESIERQYKDIEGEMHYSKCWILLKQIIKDETKVSQDGV